MAKKKKRKAKKQTSPGGRVQRPTRAEVKPDPIHDRALDEVSENDRVWFEQHPEANERIRFGLPHEYCEPSEWPACVPFVEVPEDAHARGARAVTKVTQVEKGVRQRQFLIAFPGANGWNEHDGTLTLMEFEPSSDAGLQDVLDAYGSGELTPRPGDPRTPDEEYALLADEALNTGEIASGTVGGDKIIAVPDVVMAEGLANSMPMPETPTMVRADGRTVSFFRAPV